jgi:NADPH:quinone reductase-like Zn-dependent oxidoreductase
MKAWTLTAHGDPRKVLQLREHPLPVPGASEVLIRCEGFGLNYADVMAVKGLYREAPPLPSVLGYEVVGVVEAVGSMASSALIGQRVVAMTRFGGYAEYAVTDHRALAVIQEDLPMGEAAAMATQGCTAWYAARILCPLRAGERVLVHSAAGGVGQWLVQLAVEADCEVFAVASGGEKHRLLKELGAHHVIDRRLADTYRSLDNTLCGKKLDVSFNAVGGSTFAQDMRRLGSGGRMVSYGGAQRGGLGAFGTLRFVWSMGLVVPILLMMKSRSILGINMLRIAEDRPEIIAECLAGITGMRAQGTLRAHVHRVYGSEALPEALHALGGGDTIGKVVVAW